MSSTAVARIGLGGQQGLAAFAFLRASACATGRRCRSTRRTCAGFWPASSMRLQPLALARSCASTVSPLSRCSACDSVGLGRRFAGADGRAAASGRTSSGSSCCVCRRRSARRGRPAAGPGTSPWISVTWLMQSSRFSAGMRRMRLCEKFFVSSSLLALACDWPLVGLRVADVAHQLLEVVVVLT